MVNEILNTLKPYIAGGLSVLISVLAVYKGWEILKYFKG